MLGDGVRDGVRDGRDSVDRSRDDAVDGTCAEATRRLSSASATREIPSVVRGASASPIWSSCGV